MGVPPFKETPKCEQCFTENLWSPSVDLSEKCSRLLRLSFLWRLGPASTAETRRPRHREGEKGFMNSILFVLYHHIYKYRDNFTSCYFQYTYIYKYIRILSIWKGYILGCSQLLEFFQSLKDLSDPTLELFFNSQVEKGTKKTFGRCLWIKHVYRFG